MVSRTTTYTEAEWSDLDDLDGQPYNKGKTIAERAAWDFVAHEGNGIELAVVNQVGIFGPVLGGFERNPQTAALELATDSLIPSARRPSSAP
jgi:hypothetical protein